MRILHTESSTGWGGQEIRILKEAEGLRERGHEIFFAVVQGGGLVAKAREKGFVVYELPFKKKSALSTLVQLQRIIRDRLIDIINTHSSWDAWMGGIAARLTRRKIVRTRHLSTAIKKGINSRLLYNVLADYVVTTSSCIIPMIELQSGLSMKQISCIPTGVDPKSIQTKEEEIRRFRSLFINDEDEVLVGTACFVRSWKGIVDMMKAAQLLKQQGKKIKWVVIGGGYVNEYTGLVDTFGISDVFFFTGHLESPFSAIAALDIFTLLSTAHEGVSQASLQAAFLQKPLVTTDVGGLPEVCLHEKTGLVVPKFSPDKVAEAIERIASNQSLRNLMGEKAKDLVISHYTLNHTLDKMEEVYAKLKAV